MCSLILVIAFSCTKDYLNTTPAGATIAQNAFKTTSDYEAALNGCYSALQDIGYYGRNYPIIGEILADNVKPSTNNTSRFTDLYNYSQTSSDQYLKEFWRAGYSVIHRCNTLISAVKQDSVILSVSDRNKYLGQALGLRALAHFDLYRVFAPRYDASSANSTFAVPLVTDTTFIDSSLSLPKTTAAVLIKQITQDLKQSRIYLDKQPFSPLYFNRYAAMALHARVSLYAGDYISAAYYSDSLVANNGFSLVERANYFSSWSQPFSSESIFTLSFSQNDFSGTESLGYLYSKNGYGNVIPTNDISKLITIYDIRRKFLIDGFCNKFNSTSDIVGLSNFQVIRLSEMYLTDAESQVRIILSGNKILKDDGAIAYLDKIRNRATDSTSVTHLHGKELLNKILLERRKELCFEGQRFFDKKRMCEPLNRIDCQSQTCQIDSINSLHLYTMPIPISELNANHKLTQNNSK